MVAFFTTPAHLFSVQRLRVQKLLMVVGADWATAGKRV